MDEMLLTLCRQVERSEDLTRLKRLAELLASLRTCPRSPKCHFSHGTKTPEGIYEAMHGTPSRNRVLYSCHTADCCTPSHFTGLGGPVERRENRAAQRKVRNSIDLARELIQVGRTVQEIAVELGVSPTMLGWALA